MPALAHSVSLKSIAAVLGGGRFSPLALFAASEPGGWYDPSDLTTLFQDAAGTTPVTAVEQPVGLVLDKSKGLVLGSNEFAALDFASWSNNGTVSSKTANSVTTGGAGGVISPDVYDGSFYSVTIGFTKATSTEFGVRVDGTLVGNQVAASTATSGTLSFIVPIASFMYFRLSAADTLTITSLVVSKLPGNHLSQSTSTARPVLSARVNALTYTEDFSNAAWVKGTGATATASVLSAVAGTGTHWVYRNNAPTGAQIFSVEAKSGTTSWIALGQGNTGAAFNTFFNLSNGTVGTVASGHTASITSVGDGWYLCSVTLNFTTTNASIAITNADNVAVGWNAAGTETISIRKADLRFANAGVGLPAYQRVGAATSGTSSAAGNSDYDTTGFPLYLKFDGTDDFLVSGTINPGSVDKAQVFAGVRKVTDSAAYQVIAESSNSVDANNGSFVLATNVGTYEIFSKGTVRANAPASGYSAPITNVVASLLDISGDLTTLRVNGGQVAQSTADQGTGNFGSYPLYVGSRAGTSLRFNGHLYSLILRFSAANLDAATITATETWVNGKTRAF